MNDSFIYLAALGLSCGIWDLCCDLWDLSCDLCWILWDLSWVLAVAYGIYAVTIWDLSCDLCWILWDLSLQGVVSLVVVCGLQRFQGVGLTAPRQVGS